MENPVDLCGPNTPPRPPITGNEKNAAGALQQHFDHYHLIVGSLWKREVEEGQQGREKARVGHGYWGWNDKMKTSRMLVVFVEMGKSKDVNCVRDLQEESFDRKLWAFLTCISL